MARPRKTVSRYLFTYAWWAWPLFPFLLAVPTRPWTFREWQREVR